MRRTTPRIQLVLFALMLIASIVTLQAASAAAKPWLGVYTQEITADLRDGLDLHGDGVLVNRVVEEGPADRAGLRKGDLIMRFNSRSVDSPGELARLVSDSQSGQTVALEIVREGDRRTLSVTLAPRPSGDEASPRVAPRATWHEEDGDDERPGDDGARKRTRVRIVTPGDGKGKPHVYRYDGDPGKMPEDVQRMMREMHIEGIEGLPELRRMVAPAGERARLGVRIESLTEDLASALDVPGGEGVLVLGVIEDTPAERSGLKAGDVILSVNDDPVKDAPSLQKTLRDVQGKASIQVARKGTRRTIEVDLGQPARTGRDDVSPGPGRMEGLDRLRRLRSLDDSSGDALRKEVDELRQQLRELRRQMEEQKENR